MPGFANVFRHQKRFVQLWLFFLATSVSGQIGWMGGLGPSLEVDEGFYGINARVFYGINEHICFGPEVTFFPFQELDEEADASILDANFNIHYIFEVSHKLGIYPLSGINYTIETERFSEGLPNSQTENDFGINYGFGAHYKIKHSFVFAEFKGIVGKLSDEFITVGVIFPLSKNKEQKEHKTTH